MTDSPNKTRPEQQERFIVALEAMASVGQAAKALGMTTPSAHNLRERHIGALMRNGSGETLV